MMRVFTLLLLLFVHQQKFCRCTDSSSTTTPVYIKIVNDWKGTPIENDLWPEESHQYPLLPDETGDVHRRFSLFLTHNKENFTVTAQQITCSSADEYVFELINVQKRWVHRNKIELMFEQEDTQMDTDTSGSLIKDNNNKGKAAMERIEKEGQQNFGEEIENDLTLAIYTLHNESTKFITTRQFYVDDNFDYLYVFSILPENERQLWREIIPLALRMNTTRNKSEIEEIEQEIAGGKIISEKALEKASTLSLKERDDIIKAKFNEINKMQRAIAQMQEQLNDKIEGLRKELDCAEIDSIIISEKGKKAMTKSVSISEKSKKLGKQLSNKWLAMCQKVEKGAKLIQDCETISKAPSKLKKNFLKATSFLRKVEKASADNADSSSGTMVSQHSRIGHAVSLGPKLLKIGLSVSEAIVTLGKVVKLYDSLHTILPIRHLKRYWTVCRDFVISKSTSSQFRRLQRRPRLEEERKKTEEPNAVQIVDERDERQMEEDLEHVEQQQQTAREQQHQLFMPGNSIIPLDDDERLENEKAKMEVSSSSTPKSDDEPSQKLLLRVASTNNKQRQLVPPNEDNSSGRSLRRSVRLQVMNGKKKAEAKEEKADERKLF